MAYFRLFSTEKKDTVISLTTKLLASSAFYIWTLRAALSNVNDEKQERDKV